MKVKQTRMKYKAVEQFLKRLTEVTRLSINKIINGLSKATTIISVLMMVLLAITLFTGVITRYVFSFSVPELELFRDFALIWLVLLGSAIAVREKQHLDIDIFSEYLSERLNKIRLMIVYVLTLLGIVILLFIGFAAFKAGLNRLELVPIRFLSSQPSLIYYYSAFLIGSFMMLIFHLENMKDFFPKMNNKDVNK